MTPSCLCGSELLVLMMQVFKQFLSCLCGSEQRAKKKTIRINFLSCLCGSEPQISSGKLFI
tara:strand:+ start:312 stop:494 length:183 start_codon:yes stop_codon:yes gene_type:complete